MLYRHCEYHAAPYSQQYLYFLSRVNKKVFSNRAAVALGCMGYESYDTVDEIVQDIAILKYNGYSTIELFEFHRFYNTLGYDGLISVLNSTLNGWKYPEFKININSMEFLMDSMLLFADVLLDWI